MTNGSSIDLNSNVQIRCYDASGKLIRDSSIHNKATVGMINGILQFLNGQFNNTSEGFTKAPSDEKIAATYIPKGVKFGKIGVNIADSYFQEVNTSSQIQPQFTDVSLQSPIPVMGYKFSRNRIVGNSANDNSMDLELSVSLGPGILAGYTLYPEDQSRRFVPYDWSYKNPNNGDTYETMMTEIGLVSDTGVLLARVLLDGEVTTSHIEGDTSKTYPVFTDENNRLNPIVQTESTTVIITWKIGVVSIGDNDQFITQNNLND